MHTNGCDNGIRQSHAGTRLCVRQTRATNAYPEVGFLPDVIIGKRKNTTLLDFQTNLRSVARQTGYMKPTLPIFCETIALTSIVVTELANTMKYGGGGLI